ncbi:calmodulin-lysine N-methyltransferase-like isoform X2 [Phragmites australis]|uniref:calmodulin-lysine N-methyltransferase-like isoform X2 n=1 Tax=Phragmites australis TaxID=29695 RepID=UPI002D77681B|nr:calmodulin-lysine N-methyltransferase-like isoform X2 [Phragmites australis]
MDDDSSPSPSPVTGRSRGASNATVRWSILRRALLSRSSSSSAPEGTSSYQQNKDNTNNISRKALRGFKLIECHSLPISQLTESLVNAFNKYENDLECQKDVYVCYKLPSSKLNLIYRRDDSLGLNDIETSNRYNIDTTGLVCCWPSEEVLAYYCINHSDMFRSKKVLELGSGYGLAGLVIAASTNADEVVISDGNPQVVEYIQKNISINAETFGETKVKSMILHWDKEQATELLNTFDIIVASDCTFFKQFHQSLARIVKSLLKPSATSQAIFLSPKRGYSLDKFLEIIKENGMCCELIENYDPTVWNLHKKYVAGDDRTWPNYDKEHCYPLLVRISSFSE